MKQRPRAARVPQKPFESTISLDRVLLLHDRAEHPLALKDSLGDALLLSVNRVQATVRRLARAAGVTFTTRPRFDYATLPLMCLDEICASGAVPYEDNVVPLRRVVARYPGRFRFAHAAAAMARRNVTLHESVHVLARRLVPDLPAARTLSRTQRLICDRLGEESTANAAERLSATMVRSKEERLFAGRALYLSEGVSPALLDSMGTADLFRALFVGFLTSNFLVKWMSAKTIYRLLEMTVTTRALCRARPRELTAAFRSCLELPVGFRLRTNEVTLRMLGIRSPIVEALDFEFIPELEPGGRLAVYLERATDMLIDGVAPARGRTPDRIKP